MSLHDDMNEELYGPVEEEDNKSASSSTWFMDLWRGYVLSTPRPGWESPFEQLEEARSRPWAVWLEPSSADARSPPASSIRPETMPSRPAPL